MSEGVNEKLANRLGRRCRGSTLVEAAIVLLVFLVVVFGCIELGLMIFKWSKTVEATREATRYAVVNNPASDDLASSLHCPGGVLEVSDAATGNDVYANIVVIVERFIALNEEAQVSVRYECATTGYEQSYRDLYTVTVLVRNLKYTPVMSGLLGFETEISMPEFATTLLSEDLETVSG